MSVKRWGFSSANRILAVMPPSWRERTLGLVGELPFHLIKPRFMAIEPTNACNLHCPLCPVGRGTMKRPKGFMELEKYSNLLDEISGHVRHVLMNFAGEPLLHPRIGAMVELAVRKGMGLTLGTHGNIDKMEEIVASGLPEVLFSLDGTTGDVYQKYRVGGDLDLALANLEKLVIARERRGTGLPRIILQFVVMRHNVHQIPDLVRIGRRFRVDEISLQPVCINDFFPESQSELCDTWAPPAPVGPRYSGFHGSDGGGKPWICVWAIQSVILFNGDVTICCFDPDGAHVAGNAFAPGGFDKVWKSMAYRNLRREVIRQSLSQCAKCDIGLGKPLRFPPEDSPESLGPVHVAG